MARGSLGAALALLLIWAGAPAAQEAEPTGADPAPPAEAGVPLPEPRPETAGENEPEAPGPDEEATPEAVPGPEPEPGETPAYVPPEKARATPEREAPEVPEAAVTPAESVAAAAAIEDALACEAELERRGATFTIGPSLSDEDCGVLRPVTLAASSSGVTLSPDTQMLCRTALALDIWIAEALVPASETLDGGRPESLRHSSTYVCRERSSESRISEHSRGSAVDISAILFSGRDPVDIRAQEPGSAEDRFLAEIRRLACGPFKTVLGPGTDADHAEHFHFDIAARNRGSTYCR
ncbi:extensin family protein [Aureimonas populi]|uniref:Extensin family protein n=1 Tax=Aureimonas populi TaxID=1701758 RepID=A0ABW5CH69_9HYPH|nr:extensin family protein [Aureimonas populi]